MKVSASRGKPVERRSAHTMARSSSVAFQGSLWGRAERSLTRIGTAIAPFADGLGGHAVALGQHTGALVRAGDLGADSRGGAGLGMDGEPSASPPGRTAAHTCKPPRIGFDRPTRRIPTTFRNQTVRPRLRVDCVGAGGPGRGRVRCASSACFGRRLRSVV